MDEHWFRTDDQQLTFITSKQIELVQISTIDGQVLISLNGPLDQQVEVSLAPLPSGVYFCAMYAGGHARCEPFTIVR